MIEYLESVTVKVVNLLDSLIETDYEKFRVFPYGSCIGVSAFIVPFIRLVTNCECKVAVGTYDGKCHAWVVCDNLIIDSTVGQFDSNASKVIDASADNFYKYKVAFLLDRSEESDLRDHSEINGMSLHSRDGKHLLNKAIRAIKLRESAGANV